MGKAVLAVLVLISLGWMVYGGLYLIESSNNPYSPELIFSERDRTLLIINRPDELASLNLFDSEYSNSYLDKLYSLKSEKYNDLQYFISQNENKVVIKKDVFWTNADVDDLRQAIGVSFKEISFEGIYLCLHTAPLIQNDIALDFIYNGDKKASANSWKLTSDKSLIDIYGKLNGNIEYKSQQNIVNAGKAVSDADLFAAYLPKTISSYTFQEKFYAALSDSILAESPLFEWCDKGFVEADFLKKRILFTDYKPGQIPSLVLLEKLQYVDSSYLNSEVKHFSGIRLTKDFPSNDELSFYLLSIGDKVVLSESKEICEKVGLNYELGQTLVLAKGKYNEIYSELPKAVNFRKKDNLENYSITLSNKINYTVYKNTTTDNIAVNTSEMWSFKTPSPIQFCIKIKDHIRTGNSNFIAYQNGNYELVSSEGKTIWSGKSDTTIVIQPQVIDVYGNSKLQILFSSKNKIHLLDLNGNSVNGFPYLNEFFVTSEISTLTWKDTKRFIFGDSKGNVTMLSNKGQELIIDSPFKSSVNRVFAYNDKGALKYIAQSVESVKKGHLEKNTAPVSPPWVVPNSKIVKINKQPAVITDELGSVKYISASGENTIFVGEGELLKTTTNIFIIKEHNNVLVKNVLGESLIEVKLPFNEVDDIDYIEFGKNKFILVLDGLENNVYLFDSFGDLVQDFPKEGSSFGSLSIDLKTNVLDVITVVKNNIICYKLKSTL